MQLRRLFILSAISGASAALLSLSALAAPAPRNPLMGEGRDAIVIQIQQQGQNKATAKTTTKPTGNAKPH